MNIRSLACLLALLATAGTAPRIAQAMELKSYDVVAAGEQPEICFTFDQAPADDLRQQMNDYLQVTPKVELTTRVRDKDLCLGGLAHGQSYAVTLRAGLPAADGATLGASVQQQIYVPDRPAALAFQQRGYVLPGAFAKGLPLTHVNVTRADLTLLRVNDRNLIAQLRDRRIGDSFNKWQLDSFTDEQAPVVWSGEVDLQAPRNETVTTLLPFAAEAGPLQAGVYIAIARSDAVEAEEWQPYATQWFVVSDIGLSSFEGDGGMTVQALSLATAKPLDGTAVSLLALDNAVIAEARTDADGFASFPGGLLHGRGAAAPAAVVAQGAAGDFVFLDLTRGGVDLLARGGEGRATPGALDAFLYTERGIYRPGEDGHLTALLRNRKAAAVADLPLVVSLRRPDGQEFLKRTLEGADGAGTATFALPTSAPGGTWSLVATAGEKGPKVGEATFLVADFVPPQLEVAVTSPDEAATLDTPIQVGVQADFLYGAPGSNLPGEATLRLQSAQTPFPAYEGWSFGLVQEPFLPVLREPVRFTTDSEGKASLQVSPDQRPDTTQPLEAQVTASVFDLAGRAVSSTLTLPVRGQDFLIGIRPGFDGPLPEGATASFDVVALSSAGERVARKDLRWELFVEDWDYAWYRGGGNWQAEPVIRSRRIDGGPLSVDGDKPATVQVPVGWNRYRFEVFAADGPVASSVRFQGGWWADAGADQQPDELTISLDKESYQPGDTAKVFVKPPYPAEVLLMTAGDEILGRQRVHLPAEGGTIAVPVAADWPGGIHLLVNAYATKADTGGPLPRRATGVAWLPLDRSAQRLDVSLDAPEQVRPDRAVTVGVTVSGMTEGEDVHLTLAAVDDGVLQLTDYVAPSPLDYYLGRRQIGVRQYDVYGQLIDPTGDVVGVLRSGGDSGMGMALDNLPPRNTKVVALFSGIVQVGGDGKASVTFDLPDFDGRLRLMAVAWSPRRLGSAQKTMLVRSPVIAQLTLPRFLAPGDQAQSILSLRNLDAPAGDYRVALEVEGPVSFDRDAVALAGLGPNEERRETLTLTAEEVGEASIRLRLSGPDGFALERTRTIAVRPASPPERKQLLARLEPGQSSTVTADVYAGLRPETVKATLTVSVLPALDLPNLLRALSDYPYGCVEQTTSKGLPLLYAADVAASIGLGTPADLHDRAQQAVFRVVAQQRPDGSFGLWGPRSDQDLWLSAYVGDFLLRAGRQGFLVPQSALDQLLSWLDGQVRDPARDAEGEAGQAYAHYVLAVAGADNLSDLRYFYETRQNRLPSLLARVQVAAALARQGDRARAEAAVADLPSQPVDRHVGTLADYGSRLRDLAASLTLLAENDLVPVRRQVDLLQIVAAQADRERYLSTQEMAWLVLAAQSMLRPGGEAAVSIDGRTAAMTQGTVRQSLRIRQPPPLARVENIGTQPLYQQVSVGGVPSEPSPAQRNGFTVRRYFYNFDGSDLGLDTIRQNDRFLMLLEARIDDGLDHRALLTQLLPAGWELEDLRLAEDVDLEAFPWLGRLSGTEQVEFRDDRYVAAADIRGRGPQQVRVAFVVRAVTPGRFALPGAAVEDMYRPSLFARQAVGTIAVLDRSGG